MEKAAMREASGQAGGGVEGGERGSETLPAQHRPPHELTRLALPRSCR